MRVVLQTYLPIKGANVAPKTYGEIERHLLKAWEPFHNRPLRQIEPADITAHYEKLVENNGPAAGNNAIRNLSAFLVWAVKQRLIDFNPAVATERRKDHKGDRVLKDPELAAIWAATDSDLDYDAIVRLLILTGCRLTEIGSLCWSEIFPDRIVLPSHRTKNKSEHVVFLTPMMRAISQQSHASTWS